MFLDNQKSSEERGRETGGGGKYKERKKGEEKGTEK